MAKALDDYIYCSPFLNVASLDDLRDRPGESGQTFDVRDPQPDAETLLDQRRSMNILRTAIARLPPRQRTVIRALYFAELTVTQTARLLKISAAAVVKLRTKALNRLLAALSPHRAALFA